MIIEIEINGHQWFESLRGEVLQWGQTVVNFDQKPMQVPAVIIKTSDGEIRVLPLTQELRWTKVKEIVGLPEKEPA